MWIAQDKLQPKANSEKVSLPVVEIGQIKISALGTFWFGETLLLRVSERCQWGAWKPGCVGKEAKVVLVPIPPSMALHDLE